MTESWHNACSISLASCRLRAEALARRLHNKLWPLEPLSTGESNGDVNGALLTWHNVARFNIVDRPPYRTPRIYGAGDGVLNGVCWKSEMMEAEDDEFFDLDDCSSPSSPLDEDITVNPSVDPLQDRNGSTAAAVEVCDLQRDVLVLADQQSLFDKLQKYKESQDVFYDLESSGETEQEVSQNLVNGEDCVPVSDLVPEPSAAPFGTNESSLSAGLNGTVSEIVSPPRVTSRFTVSKISNSEPAKIPESQLKRCYVASAKHSQLSSDETSSQRPLPDAEVNADDVEAPDLVNLCLDDADGADTSASPCLQDSDCTELPASSVATADVTGNVSQPNISIKILGEDLKVLSGDRFNVKSLFSGSDAVCHGARNRDTALLRAEEDAEEGGRRVLLRSISLKTGKTPPGTPRRKKIVRFADVLGLDLEAVRHIVSDDLPTIPASAFMDLKLRDETRECKKAVDSTTTHISPQVHTLSPLFQQPAGSSDFLNRVKLEWVCLESAVVCGMAVHCIIRVMNLGYEKSVTVRYTTDMWARHNDLPARYVSGSSEGATDKFAATVHVPHMQDGQQLCFAIRYIVVGQERWDNNCGQNYILRCLGYVPIQPSPELGSAWIHHFF